MCMAQALVVRPLAGSDRFQETGPPFLRTDLTTAYAQPKHDKGPINALRLIGVWT